MNRKYYRASGGNTIVEFGPALYIVLVIITFPMIALGSAGVRYGLLANAANMACQQASKARTFKTDIPAGAGSPAHLSALHTAQQVAAYACSNIGGGTVNLTSTSVYVKIQPLSALTATPAQPAANTPLTANLLNPTLYSYTCEVVLVGSIAPVLPVGWKAFSGFSVPLLNAPLQTSARADYMFENNLNLSI
jgi:hypothetical protein